MKDKFVVKRDIPILDEHDLMDDEGNVVFSLDEARLRQIAENNNRRIKETGDLTPIVIGHTKDDKDEKGQPQIVGWASHFKVKKLFNTGRKAIFCSARFLKNKLPEVKKFPRRSVELWLRKMLIDPISLLGATTPERDLGLLKFSHGEQKYSPVFPTEKDMTNDNDALVQAVLSALQETDVWKFMEAKMAEEAGGDDLEAPMDDLPMDDMGDDEVPLDEPMDDEGDDVIPDDEGDEDVDLDDEGDDDLDDDDEEDDLPPKKQYSAPSGTNTFIPTKEKRRMQKDQKRGQKFRLSARVSTLEKENKALRLKFQAAARERDLVQLESEGYIFDRAEELQDLVGLPQKVYKKRLDLMRKRYQKAPVHNGRQVHLASSNPARGMSKEKTQRVVDYATEHGITYGEALKALEGEKVF